MKMRYLAATDMAQLAPLRQIPLLHSTRVISPQKIATWLMTTAAGIQILGYWNALPGHIGEATWSDHAQFHVVLSWIWLVGLNLALLSLIWGPLQKGEKWCCPTLLLLSTLAYGGHFGAAQVVPAGRPLALWHDLALGTVWLLFVMGLAIGWWGARAIASTPLTKVR